MHSDVKATMQSSAANPSWRHRLLAAFWFLWAAVVLGFYYTRLWRLFAGDSSVWEALAQDTTSSRGLMTFFGAGLFVQVLGLSGIRWLLHRSTDDRRKRLLRRSTMVLGALALLSAVYYVLRWYLFGAAPLPWNLPARVEALSRALRALLGAGLVLLSAQVLGAGICQLLRWRPDDWREALLYRTAIGLGAVSYLSLGLATLGLYRPLNIHTLVAVVLLGGSLWISYRLIRPGAGGQKTKALTRSAVTRIDQPGDRVWRAIVLLAILIAFVSALAPEIEYDALWYHLWLPKLWLAHGQPADPVAEYISLYPMTWELIFGAGLVLGGPVAAKLLHFACLPLAGLLTYQLTRRFVPQASPWLAVALFVTVPTALWEAATAYIDLALTLHIGLVVYALLRYVEGRRWQWLALATLNLGLALATKHLALIVLTLVTSGLALRLWLEERDLRRALVPAMLLGGLSLLLPLPWYLRGWLASGNPVFPDLFGVFGASPPERWNAFTEQELVRFKGRFGRPRTALNLLTLPWDMTVHAARYGGSLGPAFLLLLPGLAVRHRRAQVTSWLMAFVLLYVAFWTSPISSFQMRFMVPITPLLAVLGAAACSWPLHLWPSNRAKWVRPVVHSSVAVLLLLNLPPFTSLHENDRVGWDGWLTHVIRQVPVSVVGGSASYEDYLVRSVPSYAAWRHINTHLPQDTRVLTFSGGDHFYSERDRVPSDATIAQTAVWLSTKDDEQQALEAMRQLGITHVLFDKRQLGSGELDDLAITQPANMATWYDLEYEDYRFALFRLRWDKLPPGLSRPTARTGYARKR